MYDLLILGAGPAGSTLARLASCLPGLRVLLLDARDLDRPAGEGRNHRIKSCGGLLAPDAQRALARLYGALPAAVLADPQLFAVRAIDLSTGREATYQRFYMNIRREAFDRWLYAQAGQADRVCDATVTGIHREAGGWTVATTDGRSFTGRFLAGADGGHSLVRHRLFPGLRVRRYVSIQEAFPAEAATPHFAAVFDPALTDYYAWGLPKDGEYLIGAALPVGRGALDTFAALKKALRPFGFRTGIPLRREATLITRPAPGLLLAGSPALADGSACLLGEAGGFISPSSAEGISYALNTALAFYQGLRAACRSHSPDQPEFFPAAGREYARRLVPLRAALLGKCLKSQILYRPLLRRLLMASGLRALPLPPDCEGHPERR